MSRDKVEPIASGEGVAVEAIVLDTNGSGDNSLVGHYVPTGDVDNCRNVSNGSGESSTDPTSLLKVDVEFIEPFQELASSCSVRLQKSLRLLEQRCLMLALSSFREEFVRSLNETKAKYFDVELVGFPTLVQLLTGFCNYLRFLLQKALSPGSPTFAQAFDAKFSIL
ncbi:hypothetical protein ACLOJK_027298 [Asimina triloba]